MILVILSCSRQDLSIKGKLLVDLSLSKGCKAGCLLKILVVRIRCTKNDVNMTYIN